MAVKERESTHFFSALKFFLKKFFHLLGNLNTLKMISNWKCDAFKDELRRAELLRELVDELTKEQAQERERGKNRGEGR